MNRNMVFAHVQKTSLKKTLLRIIGGFLWVLGPIKLYFSTKTSNKMTLNKKAIIRDSHMPCEKTLQPDHSRKMFLSERAFTNQLIFLSK